MTRSSATAGTRTIEGRLYGDPPWQRAEPFSSRWLSDGIMDRAINRAIQENWEAIRQSLARTGRYSDTFNGGQAVGEGFYNAGSSVVVRPTYAKTSLYTIVLKWNPANPSEPILVTAFPNIRGY